MVNRYIGVAGGYLGDFSYRTHAEFYPEYCGLDIDPNALPGTTRERFVTILGGASPGDQARILRGVLERFPRGSGPDTRTEELYGEISGWILQLEGASPIESPAPRITSAVVARAIGDAEALIRSSGATSGVDRVHTALHGYLLAVCTANSISYPPDASITQLFRLLRDHHPSLRALGPRPQDIEQVLRACASIIDALNPVRNRTSVAHPNEVLLPSEEAMLVINVARTLLHYLDSKLS
ncbi:MAG: abortive infection family protein [Holophagales bacterium]|nr:MAG: abortive infection family protein [Holophagales bacterium]